MLGSARVSTRPSSPSPSARTGLSALTSSLRAPSSAASSIRSAPQLPRETSKGAASSPASLSALAPAPFERFSIVVLLLSGPRPLTSAVDAILPMRLIKKRKSTSGPLKLQTSVPTADEGASPDRALHAKPSMLSMSPASFYASKHPDRARRVRLILMPEASALLEVRDESKDKPLLTIELDQVDSRTIHAVHRSTVNMPHVLFVPLPLVRQQPGAASRSPPSPSDPTYRVDLEIERAHSPTPFRRGQVSPTSSRRPSSASSITFGHSSSSSEKARPRGVGGVHLAFDTSADALSWLALLKSRAKPEIYHCPPRSVYADAVANQQPSVSEDSSSRPFRVKRQLKITIGEARLLVFSATAPVSLGGGGGGQSYSPLRSPLPSATLGMHDLRSSSLPGWTMTSDRDAPGVRVELLSGSYLLGRTTMKRRTAGLVWNETFSFPFFSVAPFSVDGGALGQEVLSLVVQREKSSDRFAVLGRVDIPLNNPQCEDAWWPILSETGRRMGDLRLRTCATEQVVFSLARYGELAVLSRQATDPLNSVMAAALWRRDLDQALAAHTIMMVSVSRGKIAEVIGGMVAREDLSADTLFRSNTPFTKCLDSLLKAFLLPSFIPHALARTVNRIVDDDIAIEILPPSSTRAAPTFQTGRNLDDTDGHMTGGQRRELDGQRQALRRLVGSCWEDIYAARQKVPGHVRDALRKIFHAVPPEVKWRAITTLFFLRLVSPVIIDPHSYGLTLAMPGARARRTLVLLAKAISALSYGGLSDKQLEMYMVMNDFAVERHEQVVDFIACVTRKDDHDSASIHDRELTGIEGFLARAPENEATDAIGQLVRESLQTKPFYLDPAADLAVFAGLLDRALSMIAEDHPDQPPLYPELGALIASIKRDERDALEYLLLRRMPADFFPHLLVPDYLPLPPTPFLKDDWLPSRPPTRAPRSQTISDPPGLLPLTRPSLTRGRSESTSTVRIGDDVGSTTLGRARTVDTSSRRPSLPTALLSPRLQVPAFGLRSKSAVQSRLESDDDDFEDDWTKAERRYADQRATFGAKISSRPTASASTVEIDPGASNPAPKMQESHATIGGRRRQKKVWNQKL